MSDLEARMRIFVKKRGLPLDVCYDPDQNSPRHGEIKDDVILVYDTDEEAAWTTLHEITELRVRPVLGLYREAFNSLLGFVEQLAYREKEKALDQIVRDFRAWREFEQASAPTSQNEEQEEE